MVNAIKRFLKQLEGWAIDLKTRLNQDWFLKARLKLSVAFVVVVLVVLFILNTTLNFFQARDTKAINDNFPNCTISEAAILTTIRDLQRHTLGVHFAVAGGAMMFSFTLSGVVLRPIKKTIEIQKRFVADASHELRTPLSTMKTNSEVALLGGDSIEPAEAIGAIRGNIEEIDKMSQILKNLLNLSRVGDKAYEISFTRVDLAVVVQRVIDNLSNIAGKKKIGLNLARADRSMVWGNETALEEMANNLIKNGVDYTCAGGWVNVSVEDGGQGKIKFCVQDSGIGINPSEVPHIFDPFYKTKEAGLLRKGTGLGLSIVNEIVKKHGGSIHVQSQPNMGTKFIVNLSSKMATQAAT